MPAIRRGLAQKSIDLIAQVCDAAYSYGTKFSNGAILETAPVLNFELKETNSPRFYNYTTDSYTFDVTINSAHELWQFYRDNVAAIHERVAEYVTIQSINEMQGHILHATVCEMVDQALKNEYGEDNFGYITDMYDSLHELFSECIDYKLINKG